jgi:hypothetical protein
MSTLEMLARSRNAARAAVLDWMNEQGASGNLRTNSQAPGWVAYETAERELREAIDALGTEQSNDNLIMQTALTLKMTFRIMDGELYADTHGMLVPLILKPGEKLSVEQHGDHHIHVRRI